MECSGAISSEHALNCAVQQSSIYTTIIFMETVDFCMHYRYRLCSIGDNIHTMTIQNLYNSFFVCCVVQELGLIAAQLYVEVQAVVH